MVLAITDQTFKEEVGEGLTLAQFWAPWCGPCKMQLPVLESIEKEYHGKVKFIKINLDENPTLSQQFDIMSIPNMLILNNGEVISQFIGFHQKEQVKQILNRHI